MAKYLDLTVVFRNYFLLVGRSLSRTMRTADANVFMMENNNHMVLLSYIPLVSQDCLKIFRNPWFEIVSNTSKIWGSSAPSHALSSWWHSPTLFCRTLVRYLLDNMSDSQPLLEAIVNRTDHRSFVLAIAILRSATFVILFRDAARVRWERVRLTSVILRVRLLGNPATSFINVLWAVALMTSVSVTVFAFRHKTGASGSDFLVAWIASRVRVFPLW